MPQWIADIIAVWPMLGVTILIAFLLGSLIKVIGPVAKKLSTVGDDWNGEPARPGFDARPGVMERFRNIETSQTNTEASQVRTDGWMEKYGPIIDKLDHEMHPNSGTSMADAVNRTEEKLNAHLEACPATVQGTTNVTVNTGATP